MSAWIDAFESTFGDITKTSSWNKARRSSEGRGGQFGKPMARSIKAMNLARIHNFKRRR